MVPTRDGMKRRPCWQSGSVRPTGSALLEHSGQQKDHQQDHTDHTGRKGHREQRRHALSHQADPKDQGQLPITFIDPLPFLSNRPVPLTPRSLWRNSLPSVARKWTRPFPGTRFSLLGGTEFRLRQGFAFGKTLVRHLRAAPSAMGSPPKRRGTACSDCPGPSYSQIAVAK